MVDNFAEVIIVLLAMETKRNAENVSSAIDVSFDRKKYHVLGEPGYSL